MTAAAQHRLESVHDDLVAAPAAPIGQLHGENVGKQLVRVGPDPV